MKTKKLLALLLIFVLISPNAVYAGEIEKGNPVASYYGDEIHVGDKIIKRTENHHLVFVNGSFVSDYGIILRNDRSLVPLRFISDVLGADVNGSNTQEILIQKDKIKILIHEDKANVNDKEVLLDCSPTIYNDVLYVPIRFVAESLGYDVKYAPRMSREYSYYYDTHMPISPTETIIKDFPNIIIDEKYDAEKAPSIEEAQSTVQQICLEGLENFRKSIVEGFSPDVEADHLDSDFDSIEKDINRMLYVGEVSRYYKFMLGPYDVLYDKYNGNLFFVIPSSGTIVKKVDVHDKSLYTLIFIVG